tara:strand:+ start:39 stop:968 length:930 start_codon:yes stop_codon:yes gene_type:complete
MKFFKPKFWNNKNSIISLIFLPISIILQLLINVKKKFIKEVKFEIPIICVGNIYVGGTGKTPLSILIAKELINRKKNPAIIKKLYSNHSDEHNLIKADLNCLFLNSKRSAAIHDAVNNGYDVAVLDDGFQDFSIKKDLNILCFNNNQLIGNGMTLPSGPLRENLNALKRSQIVIINGNKNLIFEKKILEISNKIKIFYSNYVPLNIEQFKNKKIFAFAGIGNPENFFKLLKENGINVMKEVSFPDHYQFNDQEIKEIIDESKKNNYEIVTTEKDFFRIKNCDLLNIKYIKNELKINDKNNFLNLILNHI